MRGFVGPWLWGYKPPENRHVLSCPGVEQSVTDAVFHTGTVPDGLRLHFQTSLTHSDSPSWTVMSLNEAGLSPAPGTLCVKTPAL